MWWRHLKLQHTWIKPDNSCETAAENNYQILYEIEAADSPGITFCDRLIGISSLQYSGSDSILNWTHDATEQDQPALSTLLSPG